jgi:hypothetical protein
MEEEPWGGRRVAAVFVGTNLTEAVTLRKMSRLIGY